MDILGIAKYASGGEKWTFTGPRFDRLLVDEVLDAEHNTTHVNGEYYNIHTANYNSQSIKIDEEYTTITIGETIKNWQNGCEWIIDGKKHNITRIMD